jgi:hypothetical protein
LTLTFLVSSIIASCIPTLKQPFETFLRKVRFLSKSKSQTNYYARPGNSSTGHNFQLSNLRSSNQRIKLGPDTDAESVESQLPIMPTKDHRHYTKTTITAVGGTQMGGSEEFIGPHSPIENGIRKHTMVTVQSGPNAM